MSRVLLSQKAYAMHREVSPSVVNTWAKAGRLEMVGTRVDRDKSDELLNKSLARNRQKKPEARKRTEELDGNGSNGSKRSSGTKDFDGIETTYADAKVKREHYAAEREKLNYELAAGKVCDVARATRAVYECAALTRRALERLPDRLAARVGGGDQELERRCRVLMQQEVMEVCREIAKAAENLPQQLGSAEH